jgi:hypothetical protein
VGCDVLTLIAAMDIASCLCCLIPNNVPHIIYARKLNIVCDETNLAISSTAISVRTAGPTCLFKI